MENNKISTIKVTQNTKDRLKKLKLTSAETYENIILRLINSNLSIVTLKQKGICRNCKQLKIFYNPKIKEFIIEGTTTNNEIFNLKGLPDELYVIPGDGSYGFWDIENLSTTLKQGGKWEFNKV